MPSQVHELRNILTVIMGGIETDNKDLAKAAIYRMDARLVACVCCPVLTHIEVNKN